MLHDGSSTARRATDYSMQHSSAINYGVQLDLLSYASREVRYLSLTILPGGVSQIPARTTTSAPLRAACGNHFAFDLGQEKRVAFVLPISRSYGSVTHRE